MNILSRSNFPGENSRAIAEHQDNNRREMQRLLLQALKFSTRGDHDAAERFVLLAMELNETGAEIDMLLKTANSRNDHIQRALGLINQQAIKISRVS